MLEQRLGNMSERGREGEKGHAEKERYDSSGREQAKERRERMVKGVG